MNFIHHLDAGQSHDAGLSCSLIDSGSRQHGLEFCVIRALRQVGTGSFLDLNVSLSAWI